MKQGKQFFALLLLSILSFSCNSPKEDVAANKALKAKIGQMIMVGFDGMTASEIKPEFLAQIDSGYVGGIILFDYDMVNKKPRRNIESPEQVKTLIADLQEHASIPLLMAVDQEGGKVNRLKSKYGFPASVSAKYLGTLDDLDTTRHYALLNAQTLKEVGFNLNFSPVVDTDLNPANPVIGKHERSYSDKAEIIVKHASEWIRMHDSIGVISTLKHFPGHGSSDADSHKGITDVTPYWQEEELIPFEQISKLDYATAIMTAHVVNNRLDSIYPATLSKTIITGILRERFGFDGLLFSDDLQMKAVNDLFDFEELIKLSINAGVDIVVFGNNLLYDETIPQRAVETIFELVKKGEIPESSIVESYERVMRYKNMVRE